MESTTKLHRPQNAEQCSSQDQDHDHDQDQDHDPDHDHDRDHDHDLLPGLPNHIAKLCLSRTNPSHLYSVCQSWRRVIYSNSFPPFLSLYAIILSSSKRDDHNRHHQHQQLADPTIELFALDPFSNEWKPLPPPPSDPPLRLLRSHPSFLARKLPIQSLAVSGRLVLLAATGRLLLPALSAPLVFHPASGGRWRRGPPLPEPRRWCAAGAAGGSVYVASGVGRGYKGDVARSVERWDVAAREGEGEWEWEKKAALPDGRFCREAVEAVEYKGKLCMVNVRGSGAKEGAVYDVEGDRWEAMAAGMVAGWNGPAAASVGPGGDENLYAVDERRGVLSEYNGAEDRWEEVAEAAELEGAEQMAAARGRVFAVCGNGERITVVDVAARPPRVWTVDRPLAMPVLAVHILPRTSTC